MAIDRMVTLRDAGGSTVQRRVSTLIGADLKHSDLRAVNLAGLDLTDAILDWAQLNGADVRNATLRRASFLGSDLSGVKLDGADLTDSYLYGAELTYTSMGNVDLSGAYLGSTQFLSVDLRQVQGLDSVIHLNASMLDAATLRISFDKLPITFLRGVGYTDAEIESMQGLYGSAFRFYSCFISYAHADSDFAERLHADLQNNRVTCWRDDVDMRGGQPWRTQINEAIKIRDKIVIVCSQSSLGRPEVVEEILEGIEDERRTGTFKLFPIGLDNYLFTKEAEEAAATLPARQRREDWLTYLRDYHVPSFADWRDPDAYKVALDKLIRDLKAPAKADPA